MTDQPRLKLEYFEAALRKRPGGGELANAFEVHIEEILYLINKNRRVGVVWQRYRGPEFIRAAIDGRVGTDVPIPQQVEGVPLEMLLLQMADVLQRHGSPELRRTIAEKSLQILGWARECGSITEVLVSLESHG